MPPFWGEGLAAVCAVGAVSLANQGRGDEKAEKGAGGKSAGLFVAEAVRRPFYQMVRRVVPVVPKPELNVVGTS